MFVCSRGCRLVNPKGIQSAQRLSSSQVAQAMSGLTNEQVTQKRSQMFEKEKRRQRDLIPRLEKIRVDYKGPPEDVSLILNKSISTPSHLAKHLSEAHIERSALALVNGQELWDMERPLEDDCSVELLHFHDDDPFHVNRAFWRTCSFMLGAAIESVFTDDLFVELHSFPAPNVSSGSFLYDVDLKSEGWLPSKQELMVLSAAMHRMAEKALPMERLVVDASLAQEMFADNRFKLAQIPSIAAKSKKDRVTLYRMGEHVDISGGPMVANSSFVGRRCTVAAAHPVEHSGQTLYRFQGVALPKGFHLNHTAYGILEKRAASLNTANLSGLKSVDPS